MSWLREPNAEPIPGYRLIEPLGSGGFGEVWKCEAPGGIHKAIKFVYGNLNSLDVDSVRAEQELHALQRIKEVRHPFVCSLDRIEVVAGELVIVMELAEKTLHDLYKECQSAGLIGIPRDDLLRYLRDAAEALDHMNEKHRLQHLDVKPRNLFLISDRVKVADFGLVKHLERLSASGLLGGVTPLYASPETFHGKISQHSDQYSLAIVYQELLTGHRPFTGKNVRLLAQQHLTGEPDLRALPEGERPVIARSLSKDPDKRFPNCMALISALYKANTQARVVPRAAEPTLVGAPARPKTLADTMEDIFLGEPPPAGLAGDEVDLGGPPAAAQAAPRAGGEDEEEALLEVSGLGVTVPQPETGALRPTLVIGLGGFGRRALMELRCRFVDRFGDLGRIPILRFLCIDPDPEAVNTAVRGAPEVALSRGEVYHLPLQPVGNYRRRIMEKIEEWLPREKLYAMPRSLQPQGCRALGRLAFVDNHQRLMARLRKEIQEACNPEAIYESVSQTGLALRDTTPRVYVLCSASGGSSGMLVDLGYALRRQLAQMRHTESPVNLFLLCSAPGDPASPRAELANVHATLTEINHFSDPTIPFAAEYGVEGQRIVDPGPPFGSVYLLPMSHRGPGCLADVTSHLGSYLFHEVTTPLGLRLDVLRGRSHANSSSPDYLNTPFRSLGTYAVWFPRGLLLRFAARLACRKLIESWLSTEEPGALCPIPPPPEVLQFCRRVTSDPALGTEALAGRVEAATRNAHLTDLDATAGEAVTGLLAALEEQSLQSVAQEDPANWARQALNRVRDWVGGCEGGLPPALQGAVNDWRKTRINRALYGAAQAAAEEHAARLVGRLGEVMEKPGARLAAGEEALAQLERYCAEQAAAGQANADVQRGRTQQAWRQLEAAVTDCQQVAGGFRWFSGRSNRRLLQAFMEKLSGYARQRLQEEIAGAVEHFFVALQGQLADQRRDMGFCRQRLRHLQENLDAFRPDADEELANTRPGAELTVSHSPVASTEAYWEAIRESTTARVLLPQNEQDLERAAVKLVRTLTRENWTDLDAALHERVLVPRGGLYAACMKGDVTRSLALPLMDEAIRLLGDFLPLLDVAQILGAEFGFAYDGDNAGGRVPPSPELEAYTREYLDRAAPLLGPEGGKRDSAFLLVPASHAGKVFSEAVRAAVPELSGVKVPGQADLMFCRDVGPLTARDLEKMFKPSGQAYQLAAPAPQSSPHARFDIIDWMPIDP